MNRKKWYIEEPTESFWKETIWCGLFFIVIWIVASIIVIVNRRTENIWFRDGFRDWLLFIAIIWIITWMLAFRIWRNVMAPYYHNKAIKSLNIYDINNAVKYFNKVILITGFKTWNNKISELEFISYIRLIIYYNHLWNDNNVWKHYNELTKRIKERWTYRSEVEYHRQLQYWKILDIINKYIYDKNVNDDELLKRIYNISKNDSFNYNFKKHISNA